MIRVKAPPGRVPRRWFVRKAVTTEGEGRSRATHPLLGESLSSRVVKLTPRASCPGGKIRSKGKGRGLGTGKGRGPLRKKKRVRNESTLGAQ